ncbi:hypothetical protein [Campylobacter hyointestinalis]|uniref:Uncharacterized protein n=2 Tax=Campylobacter hyointestinalis subsp. hyointestinalis TaxID=91352 RepID=A0A9W5ATI2_CAMHY|nr:hypothetical protein [Campylobacter hyointestinalis]CUU72768.1 Uncharacterised protein [Campylobacter hyointestinalis subsp. hyointestinalis]CUU83685.1 Uncharacterised protein [Campylobacter hyointestinalis subsp. hyointestinalis]
MGITEIVAIFSVIISIISLCYSLKYNRLDQNFKELDTLLKVQGSNQKYTELLFETYFLFKNMFNEFIDLNNENYENIRYKIDNYKTENVLNLRHKLDDVIDIFKENQNVKYQNIIYIRHNIAKFIYNKMANDFILNNNKESIEYRLKNIYENFDLSKIDEFCSYTECELEKLTKFHLKHKDKIDESIEILKREFIKFKFMNKNINNPLEHKFKMLIETLESINEIQYHFKIYNDKNYFLTNIIANLLLIETINIKIQDIICQNYE